jgi:hypothetical protein
MFARIKAWFMEGLVTTQQLDRVNAEVVDVARLLHGFRDQMLSLVKEQALHSRHISNGLGSIIDYIQGKDTQPSSNYLRVLRDQLDTLMVSDQKLQQFIESQLETNHDIVTTVRAVDARVEHHIQLLQGFPPDEDELPLDEKPDLGQLATQLYEIKRIVEEFKADLATQVRLSQSDYDDVLKTSDARLSQFSKRIDALQQDLLDFRVEFRQVTGG